MPDGQWRVEALVARLRRGLRDLAPALYSQTQPLTAFRMLPLGTDFDPAEVPIPTADVPNWVPVTVGARWGGPDQSAWFHAEATVPRAWLEEPCKRYRVVLRLLLGRGIDDGFGWPEGLLYVNGTLLQGINRHHRDVLLPQDTVQAAVLAFDVRAWSGMLAGDHLIEHAELALLDRTAEELFHLLLAGADLVEALVPDQPLSYALAAAIVDAFDAIDLARPAAPEFATSVAATLIGLQERLAALRATFDAPGRPTVTAIGHGHLDVAWLWRTRHTREKAARTFGVAMALMDQYPDYRFLHTTPQVFAWLARDYPALFERMRAAVERGSFEAAGAMWLESDCNLVSGESLVRQIFYGQRYLKETFGREYAVLWLPDAFGYTAALPQIMLRTGLTTFVTTKLSWSETNRIPMDTFRWRGLDGSEVLAHFITTPSFSPTPPLDKVDTYNGRLDIPAVFELWRRYQQKNVNTDMLLAFGYGDGGAGPTRQHLEQAQAIQQLPGVPRLELGRADTYFARLRERVWQHSDLPVWDGELYLEYHRGTYTTQGWLKRLHRQLEGKLLWAETVDAWRWLLTPASAPDIRPAFDEAWKTLLLHEFHDILPGSSIGAVYADARDSLSELDRHLESLIDDALAAIVRATTGASGDGAHVFNPSPWQRTALIAVPQEALAPDASVQESAVTEEPGELVEVVDVPPLWFSMVPTRRAPRPFRGEADRMPARADARTLENSFFRVELDGAGEIRSLVDKRVPGGRELFRPGAAGNHLEAFYDRPEEFDAWDIAATFERKRYPVTVDRIELLELGPLRASIRVVHTVLSSRIDQRISVYRLLPRIDFVTEIDWHEYHVLLKAGFPLDLRTTVAQAETAYGSVERPTRRNTSWDTARFEVPAHRWIDLSEGDYGVSLLNDGRYGHDVRDATVRISLLRSPTFPDPTADQGRHALTYSLFPHAGDWRRGGTVRAAYELNRPMRVDWPQPPNTAPSGSSKTLTHAHYMLSARPDNVVVEAVKRARNSDDLIVRVYESSGCRCRARIETSFSIESVMECDLLEQPLTAEASRSYEQWQASPVTSHDVPTGTGTGWSFDLRPFEVRSFCVQPMLRH